MTQVNILISENCKNVLKSLARKKSAELDRDISYVDMIKLAIENQYNIKTFDLISKKDETNETNV